LKKTGKSIGWAFSLNQNAVRYVAHKTREAKTPGRLVDEGAETDALYGSTDMDSPANRQMLPNAASPRSCNDLNAIRRERGTSIVLERHLDACDFIPADRHDNFPSA
jgi:hypothetical protein